MGLSLLPNLQDTRLLQSLSGPIEQKKITRDKIRIEKDDSAISNLKAKVEIGDNQD